MGKRFKPEIVYDRDDEPMFRCPRCGMLFKKNKDFVRHVQKSHT